MHSPVLPCAHCLRQPLPLAACWAAVDYAAPWAALVRRWKFGGQPALAQAAAQTMLARLPWAQILAQADVLLPIAPSTPRLQARGFDHTRVLAQSLLQPLQRQIPHCPPRAPANCLQRLPEANDAHQAGRKRQARICALKGAFVLLPTALPALQGQRVLLLDDVMTTGATLSSAAQTLLAAGAAQVSAVVWARTAARV